MQSSKKGSDTTRQSDTFKIAQIRINMGKLDERQDYTPDGQELPPWLAYEEVRRLFPSARVRPPRRGGADSWSVYVMMLMVQVVTTVDGVAVTTGAVVQLPQTCTLTCVPLVRSLPRRHSRWATDARGELMSQTTDRRSPWVMAGRMADLYRLQEVLMALRRLTASP